MNGYAILIIQIEESDFAAWSPDVPGRIAFGLTAEMAVDEMREVIRKHLEELHERGEPAPTPHTVLVDLFEV